MVGFKQKKNEKKGLVPENTEKKNSFKKEEYRKECKVCEIKVKVFI